MSHNTAQPMPIASIADCPDVRVHLIDMDVGATATPNRFCRGYTLDKLDHTQTLGFKFLQDRDDLVGALCSTRRRRMRHNWALGYIGQSRFQITGPEIG